MRPKLERSIKKNVHAYSVGFGFRPPYQVIVDGDFLKTGLDKKIFIKDELNSLLGEARPMVTECILKDTKARGHDFTSAYILAQKFEKRKCPHKEPVSGYQCIREIVGKDNAQHYFIATQYPKLRDRLRKIPGVPIVYVNVKHLTLGMEPMTDISKKLLKQHEEEKVKPADKELFKLKRAVLEEPKQPVIHKKRKVKGVNPLAMKKKKKIPPPLPKKKEKSAGKKDTASTNPSA
ncbi:Fcf1-domain-containing protein [Pilobolus umbonatus]|nr:Fcf1-domain-containing protein [Pilobolus umbonatus]